MSALHALWVHGHSAEVEYPDRVASLEYKGNSVNIEGTPSTENWVHFAVPSPVIIDNLRMRPAKILFRYRSPDGGCSVDTVHVYDGENRIAVAERPWGSVTLETCRGTSETGSISEFDENGWKYLILGFDALFIISVTYGIGISIHITFGRTGGRVEFEAAGCDFDIATPLAPQRLPIYTSKTLMEFPYYSSLPLHLHNDAIERILVLLHGSGASAREYLSNGLATAKAAVDNGVDGNALKNTLIVAPQFIDQRHDIDCLYGDYWRRIPSTLLYWEGGRPSGAESKEQDITGNGIFDSGTLSSFTVLDVLLEQLCRKTLFPNLNKVIIAGHSLGGRFMSAYSAASRFEQEVATPRGIHVRYLVMGSGSYVYMDDVRYTFTDDTYLTAADNDDWRGTVATLYDFGTVCTENPAAFNDWPWGLSMPVRDGTPVYPYPTMVGATQIQNQFGARDVHYLIGEGDLLESYEQCPERVQGQDTLAKTLLYFWHLEQYYGTAHLNHHLHVIPDIGHSGLREMTSPIGLAVIFGWIP